MGRHAYNTPISVETSTSIDISRIQTSQYYRRSSVTDDIGDLASSINRQGLIHPIVVRLTSTLDGQGNYSIVTGNRRLSACKALGWMEIPAKVIVANDKEAFEFSLAENIQRRNLNPVEEAYAFKDYHITYGWGGISELALRIGKSTSYVDRRMRLLGLPSEVIELVASGKMSPSAADELLPVQNRQQQSALAQMVEANRLSTRRLRLLKKKLALNPSSSQDVEHLPLQFRLIDDITQKTFDKSITIMRSAMRDLDEVISDAKENWIVYELLMEHRRVLHRQIDILIKEKTKV